MTPKETFIENCKKLAEEKNYVFYEELLQNNKKHKVMIFCKDYSINLDSPTESELRQLIYHEFGYDVEFESVYLESNAEKIEAYLKTLDRKDGKCFDIETKRNPNLSHWVDGLIEVFNKLMQEREQ